MYIYIYLYTHTKRYIYMCGTPQRPTHVGNLAVSTPLFTHFLLQTLGHFGGQKNASFGNLLQSHASHTTSDSGFQVQNKTCWIQKGADSRFKLLESKGAGLKIQDPDKFLQSKVESWILNPERLDPRSFPWALNLEAWLQVLRALSAASNWNF